MTQAYSDPSRENDPHALPDIEVFHVNERQCREWNDDPECGESRSDFEPGWYWWTCFPGCLPDSKPNGPFATQAEALADACEA